MKARPRSNSASNRSYPRATYLIKDLERAVRLYIDDAVAPLGLTAIQYTALSVLSGHPGMSSAQLARRSFVSPQAANEMVTALERRGLIRRRPGPEGGRALGIQLTAPGERALAQCEAHVDALETLLFGDLTRREAAQFREGLRACRDALRTAPAVGGRSAARAGAKRAGTL